MQIQHIDNSVNFGWNIKTHYKITELATKSNNLLNLGEKQWLSRASELPDLNRKEIEDMCSAHFYDPLHQDPSFGTKNDDVNNALSKFLFHTAEAKKSINRLDFLKRVGMALHYLQDATTPMHVQQGNYLKMLLRYPMHRDFERGKKLGASSRLNELTQNYKKEFIPFSSLAMLIHNNALFTVQKENMVKYTNRKLWCFIQERCFNRGVNSSKTYLDYILQYLPKQKV